MSAEATLTRHAVATADADAASAAAAVAPSPLPLPPLHPVTRTVVFHPVGVQPPLCRAFQKPRFAGADRCSNTSCSSLHVRELDTTNQRVWDARLLSGHEAIEAERGVPALFFQLARGEGAQFSLLRRTLEQHAPFTRRTRMLRHALLYWSVSRPPESMLSLMRPECRILHFAEYNTLTHKHQLAACIRRQKEALQADESLSPAQRRAFDFYPRSFVLPGEAAELLAFHAASGGVLDESLRSQNHTVENTKCRKLRRMQRRMQRRAEAAGQGSDTVDASEDEQNCEANGETESSPDAPFDESVDSVPLFHRFRLPDFLADFPLHYSSPSQPVSSSSSADAAAENDSSNHDSNRLLWILKPYSRGSGHGIVVTDFVRNVDPTWLQGGFVASRYVHRPLLIDKARLREEHERRAWEARAAAMGVGPSVVMKPDLRKFDLRLYIFLLSTYFPLRNSHSDSSSSSSSASSSHPYPFRAYLFTDGLARFASHSYDSVALESERLGTNFDPLTHLTNNGVNCTAEHVPDRAKGCWENADMPALRAYFNARRAELDAQTQTSDASPSSSSSLASSTSPYAWRFDYVWSQIRHLASLAILSSDAYIRGGMDPAHRISFELLGLDVLVDSEFRVHLCELNSMPDLLSSTPATQYQHTFPVDQRVKSRMLADLFTALQFRPTREEERQLAATPVEPINWPQQPLSAAERQAPLPYVPRPHDMLGGFERLF